MDLNLTTYTWLLSNCPANFQNRLKLKCITLDQIKWFCSCVFIEVFKCIQLLFHLRFPHMLLIRSSRCPLSTYPTTDANNALCCVCKVCWITTTCRMLMLLRKKIVSPHGCGIIVVTNVLLPNGKMLAVTGTLVEFLWLRHLLIKHQTNPYMSSSQGRAGRLPF